MVQLQVPMEALTYRSMTNELEKISASKSRMTVPQSRSGRRSMRVDTMLRKEKEGSLYKQASMADELVQIQKLKQRPPQNAGQYPTIDDSNISPRQENRQTSMGTQPATALPG